MTEYIPLWAVLKSREEFGAENLPLLTVISESGVERRDLSQGRQPSEDLSNYRVVHSGDLVVNRLWARFGAYGSSRFAGIISPAYWVLEIDQTKIYPRYLHFILRSEQYRQEIGRRSKNLPPNGFDLPWDQFKNILIPIPSINEQRSIADFLDAEISRVDEIMQVRRGQLELLEERRYAAVSEVLLPEILTEPAGEWPLTWLPAMPADRPLVRLGYVCRIQNGLTVDGKRNVEVGSVTRPYLRVANVQAGRLDLKNVIEITVPEVIAARCTLRPGDVLMTEGGDLDKLGRGTVWNGELAGCLHQNHVFALRPDPARLDGDYLALMTQTLHGRSYFESTGVKTTNLASTNSGKILSFRIPLPSVGRQQELVNEVSSTLLAAERATEALNRQLRLLAERRQAVVTAAVTGQFDITAASGRSVPGGIAL